jgi:hypothetical protein
LAANVLDVNDVDLTMMSSGVKLQWDLVMNRFI